MTGECVTYTRLPAYLPAFLATMTSSGYTTNAHVEETLGTTLGTKPWGLTSSRIDVVDGGSMYYSYYRGGPLLMVICVLDLL
jgi:hypothetical protein